MTTFILLIVCLAAQILIVAWLGFFLWRKFRQQRNEKSSNLDGPKSPDRRE